MSWWYLSVERLAYIGAGAIALVLFSTMQPLPIVTGVLLLTVIRPLVTVIRRQAMKSAALAMFRHVARALPEDDLDSREDVSAPQDRRSAQQPSEVLEIDHHRN
jgi:hypothetical protein